MIQAIGLLDGAQTRRDNESNLNEQRNEFPMPPGEMTMSVKRDEYIAMMKSQLDDLNQKIDTLEAKFHDASDDAQNQYRAELTKAREQSALAMAQFHKMAASGADAWDKTTAEMDKLHRAFANTFQYFKSQL